MTEQWTCPECGEKVDSDDMVSHRAEEHHLKPSDQFENLPEELYEKDDQDVEAEDDPVCDACGQVKMEAFTPEELGDLRELLDQIEAIATEDAVATLIEYKGEEVVFTTPENVEEVILKALEEVAVEVESCDD